MDQESEVYNTLVQLLQSGDSELNKQALTLLNTILAQIKKQSPNITDTQIPMAIFALIINLLNSEQQDFQPFLLLLNMMMNRVNVAILKRFVIQIQNLMVQIKRKDQKYMKYCIVILTQTIQIMSKEEFLQNDQHNMEIIRSIIDSLWSDNSLIRKEAQKCIKLILEQKFYYKTQISIALKEYIVENLESRDLNRLLAVTQFINYILQILPIEVLGDINYSLIKALDTEDEEIMTHIYLCLENIMGSRPLTVEITESLLKEFLNNQPSFYKDPKAVQAYGQCLVQTLLHLNTLEPKTAKKYITSCIAVLQEILLVENDKSRSLSSFAQKTLELLIENTVDSTLWKQNQSAEDDLLDDFLKIDIDFSSTGNAKSQHFQKIIIMLKNMLTSRYFTKLRHVFSVFGTFFQQIDASKECLTLVDGMIMEFLEFKNEDKIQVAFKKCLGRLISNIGSEYFLEKFPMSLNGSPMEEGYEEVNHLWLLPYFQKNAQKQRLSTFVQVFVPLISKIADNVNITISGMEGYTGEQRILKSIHYLLWECFPNFVSVNGNDPQQTQILSAFLGNIPSQLKENNQHFGIVLRGLSALITSLTNNKNVLNVMRDNAQALISHLAKLIVAQKQKSKIILNVIGYLAQVAPKDYLDKAFKRNITKLIQDKTENKLQHNMSNSLKNFEIINQIIPSIEIKDTKWDVSIQFVKLMVNEQNSLQKKAYRFLRILIHKIHYTFLPQIIEVLNNFDTVLNYSRPIRIQLIKDFWAKLNMQDKTQKDIQDLAEFIQQFLPELIVGLRDSNKKCRKMAQEVFQLIGQKMEQLGMLKDFVSMASAGLAGETSLMKANSITAVSFLIETFGVKLDKSYIKDLQTIIMMLVKDENKEVFKAILYFLKKFQKNMTKDVLQVEMKQLFAQIFQTSDSIRHKFLPQIKQILTRLIRKFGVEAVANCLPEKHQNLPKSIVKADKRIKKEKEKFKMQKKRDAKDRKQQNKKQTKDIDEEDDNNGEKKIGDMDEEDKGGFKVRNINEKPGSNLLLKYDTDEQKFHFQEKEFKQIRNKRRGDDEKGLEDVLIKDGKLIVNDLEELARAGIQDETGHKRKREDRFADFEKLIMDDKKDEDEKDKNVRKIAKVRINKTKKFVHNIQESGESYRPADNTTGGDVQIKNKPEPYAYVSLNPKALNKRHRNKAVKTFDHVFNNQQAQTSLKGLKTKKVKKD